MSGLQRICNKNILFQQQIRLMSKYSPLSRGKEYSISQHRDTSRKLEKSHTTTEGIQLNQTSPYVNPYLQQLDRKSTDKKRSTYLAPYHAPVLLEQNRELMAENQKMALLLHQKNMLAQLLEEKCRAKEQEQDDVIREVQKQKAMFISQILEHKESTDTRIRILEQALSKSQEEKVRIEISYKRALANQKELTEKQRNIQLQQITSKYHQNISTLQSEKLKYQTEQQHLKNTLKAIDAEHKQKIDALKYEIEKMQEDIKHTDHMRKMESAELKQFYQNKLQKVQLEHRRDKEILLAQHDNQVRKMQNDIARLKLQQQESEEKMRKKHEGMAKNLMEHNQQQDKVASQMQDKLYQVKQKCHKDQQTMRQVFEAEHSLNTAAKNQHIHSLEMENQRLTQLLKIKSQEQVKVYAQFDAIRDRYCNDLEQYQATVSQLLSKMFVKEAGYEQQKELLKNKLAMLREADLSGLKQLYENQIKGLSDKLAQKDEIISTAREKLHEQLRRKSELRKQHELEYNKQRQTIKQLSSKINDLQIELGAEQNEIRSTQNKVGEKELHSEREKLKTQKIRQDELNHLQDIIKAKDREIEQLEHKMELLKNNQSLQITRKEEEILTLMDNHKNQLEQKLKLIHRIENQLEKYKQIMKQEQEENKKTQTSLNTQRKNDIQNIQTQLTEQKQKYSETILQLQNEIRSLTLELSKMKNHLQHTQNQHNQKTIQLKTTQKQQTNREKEDLQQFYQQELKFKDEQIADLVERNTQLTNDVIDARENYAVLEKKLENLIQSQSALRDIEKKVLNMGKQNNIVKNIQDLR